jgi:hypothetical protein
MVTAIIKDIPSIPDYVLFSIFVCLYLCILPK